MNQQTTVIVSRSGFVGGTLTSLLFAIQVQDVGNAIVLACIGAASNFCTVRLLNYLDRKFRRR